MIQRQCLPLLHQSPIDYCGLCGPSFCFFKLYERSVVENDNCDISVFWKYFVEGNNKFVSDVVSTR